MSSKLLCKLFLITILLVFLLSDDDTVDCRRGKGSRRRKMRKQNSKVLFHINPKRAEYYLNENGAQIVRASHFDYEFYLGHKIIFICVSIGDPLPTITWSKDGVELDNTMHNYLHINEWKIGEGKEAKIKSKLEIDPARQMDSGTYECMANNKYAVDRKTFKADF